jgi:hypothetical protein
VCVVGDVFERVEGASRLIVDESGRVALCFSGLEDPVEQDEFLPHVPAYNLLSIVAASGIPPGEYLRSDYS